MIIASDLMGTLTTGSPFLGVVDWVRNNQSRMRGGLYFAAAVPSYFLAKNGWIDWQAWGQKLMLESLGYIKDATPEKLAQVSEWVVEHDFWRKRRKDVIARLARHREEKAQIYIVSSVVEPFVEPFARRIGAKAIGTPVEIVDGSVKLSGELMTNEKKVEQIFARLGVNRVDFAYGDTILDAPLLEHARHPVAVYPDEKLKAIALQRGWEIIGDTPKGG